MEWPWGQQTDLFLSTGLSVPVHFHITDAVETFGLSYLSNIRVSLGTTQEAMTSMKCGYLLVLSSARWGRGWGGQRVEGNFEPFRSITQDVQIRMDIFHFSRCQFFFKIHIIWFRWVSALHWEILSNVQDVVKDQNTEFVWECLLWEMRGGWMGVSSIT